MAPAFDRIGRTIPLDLFVPLQLTEIGHGLSFHPPERFAQNLDSPEFLFCLRQSLLTSEHMLASETGKRNVACSRSHKRRFPAFLTAAFQASNVTENDLCHHKPLRKCSDLAALTPAKTRDHARHGICELDFLTDSGVMNNYDLCSSPTSVDRTAAFGHGSRSSNFASKRQLLRKEEGQRAIRLISMLNGVTMR